MFNMAWSVLPMCATAGCDLSSIGGGGGGGAPMRAAENGMPRHSAHSAGQHTHMLQPLSCQYTLCTADRDRHTGIMRYALPAEA